MILIALFVKLTSKGPALYWSDRMGINNTIFRMPKFRTMKLDAPEMATHLMDNPSLYLTSVGSFLRKFSLDELPQLWSIMKGDMSFVGPRPERPFFVDKLAEAIPFYRERHSVKPGITGWAQVNYPYGASLEDAKAKLAYDLYYVKNRTIFLDLVILVHTIRVILFREGAR